MGKKVKSKEAFVQNATTKIELKGAIVGRYTPSGPNKWDDFDFERDDGEEILTVTTGTRIQVEPLGAEPEVLFRISQGRNVLTLRWKRTENDEKEVASGKWGIQEAEQATRLEKILGLAPKNDPRDDMMEYFLATLVEPK